ncbi:LysR family transcriptional regulator [Rhizobium chutanense]|uniref:HTH-type transcriptional regulator TtuA n=1 Tax=Rhizobium chutanense TaxID=2035448 RepID=A0A2A6JEA4_9HYPH|nr:LysR family transcriptional regulator [Rhizobium chutanense]
MVDRLTSLEVFVLAVKLGSLAEAARASGLSAGMVGKHMRSLEGRLGTRLLNRTTRRLNLTEAGSAYYEHCQRILAELAEADQNVMRHQIEPRGLIRLNAPVAFGEMYVARAVAEFMTQYSAIQIEMILNNYRIDLMDGGCDLAIRIGRMPDSNLIARRVASAQRIVCAAPSYLSRQDIPFHPDDLKHHNCLLYLPDGDAQGWKFKTQFGEIVVSVDGSGRSNSGAFLREIALAGIGIIRLPSFIVSDDLAAGRLVPLLPDYIDEDVGVHAVFLDSRPLSVKMRTFIDFLIRYFEQNREWDSRI